MTYLLLVFPALVLVMAVAVRSGKVSAIDTACSLTDLELDRRSDVVRAGSAAPDWVKQRVSSRVAARPMAHSGSELLAS